MVKIKICGLMQDVDCEFLNELMPDYAGFIFAEKSRRYIPAETAKRFREKLDKAIKTVGVFVDEETDKICSIADMGILDAVQLHGSETDETVREIKDRTGLTVIKAFTIRGASDIDRAMRSEADILLLDNGAGTGKSFDWDCLEDVDRKYFLAGGLDPDNVGEAVSRYMPYGVDVSTGVEVNGQKNLGRINGFIKAVRQSDYTA